MAEAHDRIVLIGVDEDVLTAAAAQINSCGSSTSTFVGDVSNPVTMTALAGHKESELGSV